MNLFHLISGVIDARRPSLIRILIGIDAVLRGIEARGVMLAVTTPEKLQLPLFDWLRVPAQPWLDTYIGVWIGLAVFFTVGFRTLWTGLALSVVMFASLFFDQQTYSNHLYFISLIVLLLSLAGAGARYSVDSWMGRGSPVVAGWPITLLKIQLSLLYFFGSIAKINSVYLSGAILDSNLQVGGLINLPPEMRTMSICAALSVVSVVADLGIAIGLWIPRIRLFVVAGGIVFHIFMVCLLTANLSGQLAMFAVACMALYLLFFPQPAPPQSATAQA